MEDKVLWIALKLFLVWLFAMSFCLCICNCLFIRSDKRKSRATKLAATQVALERHKGLSKQCCDCDDEEKMVGSAVGGKENPLGQRHQDPLSASRQPHLCQIERQLTDQVPSGLMAHSAYIQRTTNPTFTFQHPSADDVNRSQLAMEIPIDIDTGSDKKDLVKRNNSRKVSSELLKKLLRTPSNKCVPYPELMTDSGRGRLKWSSAKDLLFGKEKRFPRIETASNPDLNVEKGPAPSRVPFMRKNNSTTTTTRATTEVVAGTTSGRSDGSCSSSNSNSSMALPQPPAFVITEVEGLERPRSSSFSGTTSSRHPSPYRIRITPSPTPSSGGMDGDGQFPVPHISLSMEQDDLTHAGAEHVPLQQFQTFDDLSVSPSKLRNAQPSNLIEIAESVIDIDVPATIKQSTVSEV